MKSLGFVYGPNGKVVTIIERDHSGLVHCSGCKNKSEQTKAYYQNAGHGDCGPFCTKQCAAEDAQEQHGPSDEDLDYTYGSDGWRGM
jgi:hypothetical protein